ncbi:MAG TPA: copper oxidase [Planctomycetota bacterium]|nr:copper oxidase [Planctomycetota bacterium]
MATRREFLERTAMAAAFVGWAAARSEAQEPPPGPLPSGGHGAVVTPDGATLPFRVVDGVKVFHLIAEPVRHEFAPGLAAECWGYNGRVHGPTIEGVEGDRVRIYVTNKLPDPTSVHWHGLPVPSGMDGVGGLSQRTIASGETFRYEFTLTRPGTFMYHSHHDEMTQMAMGLMGMFVVHPREPARPPPDRDYVYLLSEWSVPVGAARPDPNEMTDFNVLTMNGKAFPGTTPIVAKLGERVRIRFGNLSAMDHHPMHLHGMSFRVVETDGGMIPEAGQWPETTVLVPVGTTRTIEFTADNPGDWALHCHMTHHVMNQMGHGIPNLVGVDPSVFDERLGELVPELLEEGQTGMHGEETHVPRNSIPMLGGPGPFGYVTMGGMFTILKVREENPAPAGWYANPHGTLAQPASAEQMHADGIGS